MIYKLSLDKTDKKPITTQVDKATFKEFNSVILEEFGNVHGHIGESINESMKLWIKLKKGEISIAEK
ncbi:MAG: hypothetical protein ACFFDN_45410 [Candidatus Hodarchaeota archaeon]